jgi:hypothetical protein
MQHPAYILNQRKKLYQKISIFDLWETVEIFGVKLGRAAFGLFQKKNATTSFSSYLKFATKAKRAFSKNVEKKFVILKSKPLNTYFHLRSNPQLSIY